MLEQIKKYVRYKGPETQFTVMIPTWNNLPFLKNCIQSLEKNSTHHLQIIVFVNEGKDETVKWLLEKGNIDIVHSATNMGICYSMNVCRSLIKSEYLVYLNDDMYVLPDWDKVLFNEIQSLNTKMFMLSSTLIEPTDTGNASVIVKNYGQDLKNFKEEQLLSEYSKLKVSDWSGSTWPPNVVHLDLWDMVGGLSVEFSPGMYSDPDFSKKIYEAGVRIFKGKGDSLVYHFGSKSTGRVRKNKGRNSFIQKWGMSAKFFTMNFLGMGTTYQERPETTKISSLDAMVNRVKRILAG